MSWHPFPIFVYGTLKQGQPNFYLLESGEFGKCEYLGRAITMEARPLVVDTVFYIPFCLDQSGHGHKILGELYRVDERMLARLDQLEDHPIVYTRDVIKVKLIRENNEEEIVSRSFGAASPNEKKAESNGDDVEKNPESKPNDAHEKAESNMNGVEKGEESDVVTCETYLLRNFKRSMLSLPCLESYSTFTAVKPYWCPKDRTIPFHFSMVKEDTFIE